MAQPSFHQISIVGVGLLGGSLGLAVRRLGLARSVVGIGHRESTLQEAVSRGAIDRFTLSVAEGVRDADLVVLATPVGLFDRLMRDAAPALKPGCIVTDVGSTKRSVLQAVLPHLPEGCRFVGSHPLAGSENRGITAAVDDLYTDSLVLVVPTPRCTPADVARVEAFWQATGARTRVIDADAHDHILAETSHLPHLVAAALVACLDDEATSLVARGFLDTTRIASGNPPMWRDIFMTNRDQLILAIDRFQEAVNAMKAAAAAGDADEVQRLLADAKNRRDELLKG